MFGWMTAAATIGILLLLQVAAAAQDVTEPALKAAFIYNFTKFTDWPEAAAPASESFVLCVVGDEAVGGALEQMIKGRAIGGHSMAVAIVAPTGPQRACRVLYLSGMTAGQATQIITGLRDLPVLTISDLDGFVELGGIAQLFFEHGRLRFNVQVGSATRARLHISSRLLALAKPK
jgi:hypothetical protein